MATVTYTLQLNPVAAASNRWPMSGAAADLNWQSNPSACYSRGNMPSVVSAWEDPRWRSSHGGVEPLRSVQSRPSHIVVNTGPSSTQASESAMAKKKRPSFMRTVGSSIGSVSGATLKGVSDVLGAWKDYTDGLNGSYLDKKKEEALESVAVEASRGETAGVTTQGTEAAVQRFSSTAPTQTADRETFVERLATGKERWDVKRRKFVSMVPPFGTASDTDYQPPPSEAIVLDGHSLQWDSEIEQWRHVYSLWDPEKQQHVAITQEIADILTCENHGLNATSSLEDRARTAFGPSASVSANEPLQVPHSWQQSSMPVQHLPLQQSMYSNISLPPQPEPWQQTASYTSQVPHSHWPDLTQTGYTTQPALPQSIPPMQFQYPDHSHDTDSSYNSFNLTPPSGARPRRGILKNPGAVSSANQRFAHNMATNTSNHSHGPRRSVGFAADTKWE